MAKVTIWPNGLSGGHSPDVSLRRPGKRGQIKGWSRGAARRNLRFLWSIATDLLDDTGWAITLTSGETPETAAEWEHARSVWLQRCRDAGMTRYHWVTEWTARGRPHMHAAVYGVGRADKTLFPAWLDIADAHGWPVSANAQHFERIRGATGWLQYVAKHAARGVVHYQRDGAPEGWETTGRLWGYGGDWPTDEPEEVEMGSAQYVLFRGLVWDWMLSDMVQRGVAPEFVAETKARWDNPEHGHAHGVSGWIPGEVAYAFYQAAIESAPADHAWES
jgi:hypothetical protein